MIRWALFAAVVVLLTGTSSGALANPVVRQANSEQQPKADPKSKPEPKGSLATLTGCVDEQEGHWVLVSDQTMAVIATLAADGFPMESFAKHMGQKVTVRGTASPDTSHPLFRVRSLEMVSESCAAR